MILSRGRTCGVTPATGAGRRRRICRDSGAAPALLLAAAFALCACGCAAQPKLPAVEYELEPWAYGARDGRTMTTAHYEVHSTITDGYLLGALARLMEHAYDHYSELVPPARNPAAKMQVYLFATRPEWVRFTREFTGPRARQFLNVRNGGYSERGVSVIQYTAHQTSFPIMAHEGFHQYLYHHVSPQVPAWLNEGLAVACEGQRWEGDAKVEFDPWNNPLRRNTLAQAVIRKRLFALKELLETHAGRIVPLSNEKIGTYYAQLWALVLFLREGQQGKYADGFARLLDHLDERNAVQFARAASVTTGGPVLSPGEALFRTFITDDIDGFEREYVEFMTNDLILR